mmetsp:Transcript_22151/g.53126  ORF Transcript_22151/g.53126 Transcript_22151/m.53126 type:complete len:226 (+) Transcript_22151:1722-2399(+)
MRDSWKTTLARTSASTKTDAAWPSTWSACPIEPTCARKSSCMESVKPMQRRIARSSHALFCCRSPAGLDAIMALASEMRARASGTSTDPDSSPTSRAYLAEVITNPQSMPALAWFSAAAASSASSTNENSSMALSVRRSLCRISPCFCCSTAFWKCCRRFTRLSSLLKVSPPRLALRNWSIAPMLAWSGSPRPRSSFRRSSSPAALKNSRSSTMKIPSASLKGCE